MKIKQFLVMCSLTLFMSVIQVSDSRAATNLSFPDNAGLFRKITGIVKDSKGQSVIGATVTSVKGDKYAITDVDGKFSIENAILGEEYQVMCLGYQDVKFNVTDNTNYTLVMREDNLALDEVVVVGYGAQKKTTVTGSVSAVGSDEIVKTKNLDVRNMLTGRVPGLRVVQTTSEPGASGVSFNIRGFGGPLVIIDGVARGNISTLDPNDIESISVLKDAAAAVYGVKAANGVVLVTTKSGTNDGKVTINYNGNMTWQMTSGLPATVDAVDYMRMYNEKTNTSADGAGFMYFSEEEIQKYITGEKQSTDWYRGTIREFVPQTQHNLSVSGGNKRVSFYTNIGYQYQEGFFTYGTLNYNRFNLRTKIQANITDNLVFDINLSGMVSRKYAPRTGSATIIRELWKNYPTDPIYANNTEPYYYFVTMETGINPIALLDTDLTGYIDNKNKNLQSSASLTYNLPYVKGLSFKAMYSYDYSMGNTKTYTKSYELYRYNEITEAYDAVTRDAPSSVRRGFNDGNKSTYQLSISYNSKIADNHNINALLLYEGIINKGDNFYAQRELSLDVDQLFAGNTENQIGAMNAGGLYEDAQLGLVGRLNYDFKGKYLVEFLFRYDGTSKFDKKHRFGFFPSGSIGYRISEENFWKKSPLKFINNLKVRASYGIMGDDAALDYQYLTGYSYPSSFFFFDGRLVNGVANLGIPNPNITWYTAHTMNLGVDLEAWKGLFGLTFDLFQRSRYGLLATRNATLPGVVGASLPQENLNSDRNIGFELEISHKNYIGKDFYYSVKANFAITRAMNLYVEQSQQRSTWHAWKNNTVDRYKNIWWGLEAGGQFTSFDEIAEFPIKTTRTNLPGDYYYKDWNGDGFIDDMDNHPMGFNSKPMLNYGIILDLGFKGFDLNVLFQGAAMSNVAYSEKLRSAMPSTHPPLDFWADRWRPAIVGADPYKYDTEWMSGKYPSMGGTLIEENSEFNVHNSAYLRLKNIELGYTLPKKWMSKVKISALRFYLSGYNLLTFSGLTFVDPEHPNDNNGYMYPLNKTITVGMNLKF